jgi:hypothetical protein
MACYRVKFTVNLLQNACEQDVQSHCHVYSMYHDLPQLFETINFNFPQPGSYETVFGVKIVHVRFIFSEVSVTLFDLYVIRWPTSWS